MTEKMSYNGENIKQPNVGWFFSRKYITENDAYLFDKQIATICANYGKLGFSFITYPIGGIYRYNCQINKNRNARPIHLPGFFENKNILLCYMEIGRAHV